MEIYIEISGKNHEIFLDKAGWLSVHLVIFASIVLLIK